MFASGAMRVLLDNKLSYLCNFALYKATLQRVARAEVQYRLKSERCFSWAECSCFCPCFPALKFLQVAVLLGPTETCRVQFYWSIQETFFLVAYR